VWRSPDIRTQQVFARLEEYCQYSNMSRNVSEDSHSIPTAAEQHTTNEENSRLMLSRESLDEDGLSFQLPAVDVGSNTRLQCLLAIFFGIASSLACIASGIGFYYGTRESACPSDYGGSYIYCATRTSIVYPMAGGLTGEAISLFINLVLTQCLEGLAFVHSISLRWALIRESRLKFNTNIRLFTSSRSSRANGKFANAISAALVILCYAATSLLFIPFYDMTYGYTYYGTFVNSVALWTLGVALLGQTLIAILCFYSNLQTIPSWTANPLNTTVIVLAQNSTHRKAGRCMLSLESVESSTQNRPTQPQSRQPSQWRAIPLAKYVMLFTWILVVLAFTWFLTIVLINRTNVNENLSPLIPNNPGWTFIFSWDPAFNGSLTSDFLNSVTFGISPDYENSSHTHISFGAAFVIGILFVSVIQGLQTMGLHCAELVVNLARDEDTWRSLDAARSKPHFQSLHKQVLSTQPFLAALTNWKYNVLFIFKFALHWILGQCLQPYFTNWGPGDAENQNGIYFNMNHSRLLLYFICAIAFATFVTLLGIARPKGPQPAAYGNVQILADLIDDWSLDENGCFWWGDKGVGMKGDGVRHAGMSARREELGRIRTEALYAGD
jgi:hypothetical protein